MCGRERIRAESQLARAAESSRHAISKLALELLQKRHHALHLTNIETKIRAIELAEKKRSLVLATLTSKHDEETAELEDAMFELYEEFDMRREAWVATTNELLAEESSKHAGRIKALLAQKSRDDGMPQQRSSLTEMPRERHRRHSERIAGLEANWKSRQRELKMPRRAARVEIEDEYQLRLVELQQNHKAIQQRQEKDLEMLASEHESALAHLTTTFEVAENELREERRGVDAWWCHIKKESAACLQQIDEDEEHALGVIDRMEASEAFEEENVTVPANAQSCEKSVSSSPQAVAKTITSCPTVEAGGPTNAASTDSIETPVTIVSEPRSTPLTDDSASLRHETVVSAFAEVGDGQLSEADTLSDPDSPFFHAEIEFSRAVRFRSSSPDSISSEAGFVEI